MIVHSISPHCNHNYCTSLSSSFVLGLVPNHDYHHHGNKTDDEELVQRPTSNAVVIQPTRQQNLTTTVPTTSSTILHEQPVAVTGCTRRSTSVDRDNQSLLLVNFTPFTVLTRFAADTDLTGPTHLGGHCTARSLWLHMRPSLPSSTQTQSVKSRVDADPDW